MWLRNTLTLLTFGALGLAAFTASSNPPATQTEGAPTTARLAEAYGKLPLSFEANQGQSDGQVKFLSWGAGYSLFLTPQEVVLALRAPPTTAAKTQDLDAEHQPAKEPLIGSVRGEPVESGTDIRDLLLAGGMAA